jgi:Xaa-Pro aminopeptidase
MPEQFRVRRERVLQAIQPGALVLFSAPVSLRNNDIEHEYRQDSDFFYLTGFDEPESVLVLRSTEPHFVLFVRPRNPERETWDGPRAGLEGARRDFGADVAYAIDDLDSKLPELLSSLPRLYYRVGVDLAADVHIHKTLSLMRRRARLGIDWPTALVEPGVVLHELRLLKDAGEVALMQQAADITAEAHIELMRTTKPGMFEYELEGLLRRTFRARGAERHAYSPIVGSGPNATILHHRRNDRRIEQGDLVLVDAGCEYEYYASDVTRTFPADKRFNPTQRAVYEVVLAAQLAAIEQTRPGATLEQIHQVALEVIVDGLIELGLIDGPRDAALEDGRYKKFYMHRSSHWLGMDVHDVGSYFQAGAPRVLESGMVLTVEPGIYIAANAEVEAQFRGIGVRIEDDVLVAANGPLVLSAGVPKTVDEVERACAG